MVQGNWTQSDSRRSRSWSRRSASRASKWRSIQHGLYTELRRNGEAFTSFEAKFDDCTVVLEPMTLNTFVLVVSADPRVGESCLAKALPHGHS